MNISKFSKRKQAIIALQLLVAMLFFIPNAYALQSTVTTTTSQRGPNTTQSINTQTTSPNTSSSSNLGTTTPSYIEENLAENNFDLYVDSIAYKVINYSSTTMEEFLRVNFCSSGITNDQYNQSTEISLTANGITKNSQVGLYYLAYPDNCFTKDYPLKDFGFGMNSSYYVGHPTTNLPVQADIGIINNVCEFAIEED